nr:DUF2274 domain-containing protein [Alcaligenes faecalis]
MRPAPLRPAATVAAAPAQPQLYLTNDEAADYLRLSPRTLEKQRVIGGGPKFRKFGRRVMYAVADLDTWADARSFDATSDPKYAAQHAQTYGEAVDAATLIPPMLEAFMAGDRGFRKVGEGKATAPKPC